MTAAGGHWDCYRRAELKERARQAGSDKSLRSMRGRLGAYTQERFAAGYRMQQGLQAKFERKVDPEGKLSPQERAKRAEYARKAHMQRMALKSCATDGHRLRPGLGFSA